MSVEEDQSEDRQEDGLKMSWTGLTHWLLGTSLISIRVDAWHAMDVCSCLSQAESIDKPAYMSQGSCRMHKFSIVHDNTV